MFTLYGVILLAIPFFIIFPFVKNKKKFTIKFFIAYSIFVLIEMLIALYYYIYVIKKQPAHFIRCHPLRLSRLTQSLSKNRYHVASSFHSLSTASAISVNPKPFKSMRSMLLAFLMLASLLMHIRFAHYGLSVVFVLKQASTKSSTHPIHFVACTRRCSH